MRLFLGIAQALLALWTAVTNAMSFLDLRSMMETLDGARGLVHDTYLVSLNWAYFVPALASTVILAIGGWILIKDHNLLGAAHGSR